MKRITVMVALWIAITGCGSLPTGAPERKTEERPVRYAVGREPESLDPRKSTGFAETDVQAQIFEGLTVLDAVGNPGPAAAARWEVSPDGRTYRFFLRPGLRWSNGDPLTARDFEYSWKSVLDPSEASRNAYYFYIIQNGEAFNRREAGREDVGVKAIGDDVLEVRLEAPAHYFPSVVSHHSFYPVHRRTVESDPQTWIKADSIVGNGPFRAARWVRGSSIDLRPNPYYWDAAAVRIRHLTFLLTDSNATELALFENRQIEMSANIPRAEAARLKRENKLTIFPEFGVAAIWFNHSRTPFNDVNVRKALTLAIDRQSIVENVGRTGELPAAAWVPPGAPDSAPGLDFRAAGKDLIPVFDPVEARRLLAEAGFPGGQGFPRVTLHYVTSDVNRSVCEAVQEMWKKHLGIAIELANRDNKVMLQMRRQGDFDMVRYTWVGDYLDATTMLDLFITEGGNNFARYSNPDYDRLLLAARTTGDNAARIAALHKAENLLIARDTAVAPVHFVNRPAAVSPLLKGVLRTPLGQTYFKNAVMSE